MATHSSILAWRIPWVEEPGGLQTSGLPRVGHDWSDLALHTWKINVIVSLEAVKGSLGLPNIQFSGPSWAYKRPPLLVRWSHVRRSSQWKVMEVKGLRQWTAAGVTSALCPFETSFMVRRMNCRIKLVWTIQTLLRGQLPTLESCWSTGDSAWARNKCLLC